MMLRLDGKAVNDGLARDVFSCEMDAMYVQLRIIRRQ